MEQSPSWEANIHLFSQEVTRFSFFGIGNFIILSTKTHN